MHERYSWPQSHDLFLAHVNRQFLCRDTDRGRRGRMQSVVGEGGAGVALNGKKK